MEQIDVPVVQTVGLTKVFKDFWRRDRVAAVDDLNLEIRRGEVFGLLGPNGSGKSTTIKMLLGLLYPTRGRISLFGRPPTDVAVKSKIGFLPEESYLYRFLDARETLDLYGRLFRLHSRQRRDRIDKLLDMVGLTAEAKRRIGEYSKGMARRIGLAQALINDPEFLILDEPTSGMDPIGTRQIKEVIRELSRKGKTILLSSHLLADVEDVCDRITILYGGQQRAAGTIGELLSQEDRTQITAEKLSPETVEQVRDLVQRLEHKSVLKVGAPTDRLESFFMKIVEEAQAANIKSSGVRAGGEVPDFLSARQPEPDLIQSLVVAAEKKTPATTQEALPEDNEPGAAEPERDILEELTATKPVAESVDDTPPPATGEAGETPEEPKPDDGVNRSVIDDLLSRGGSSQSD